MPFFFRPARKPRTVCCCQPVASTTWAMVAPSGAAQQGQHRGLLGVGAGRPRLARRRGFEGRERVAQVGHGMGQLRRAAGLNTPGGERRLRSRAQPQPRAQKRRVSRFGGRGGAVGHGRARTTDRRQARLRRAQGKPLAVLRGAPDRLVLAGRCFLDQAGLDQGLRDRAPGGNRQPLGQGDDLVGICGSENRLGRGGEGGHRQAPVRLPDHWALLPGCAPEGL